MKLALEIFPTVYDHPDAFEILLTFESNLNMNKYTMKQVIPKDYDSDLRTRILDSMFYELRKKIDLESQALKAFLSI